MLPDPTIQRIRQVRHEISEECGHDPQKLVEYYRRYQEKLSGRLIGRSGIGSSPRGVPQK